jgi:hypothetical protein
MEPRKDKYNDVEMDASNEKLNQEYQDVIAD